MDQMARTQCGTPYNMAPEVCNGSPYDFKADIWAMGVIVYELVTFKKPFDSDKLQSLFNLIINEEAAPVQDGRSTDLKMLCKSLLNKDVNKRPSIFDIATLPCVKKKIKEFIKQHDVKDTDIPFLELEPSNKPIVN